MTQVTVYGTEASLPSPMMGYWSQAKFDASAPPLAHKDDEGINPVSRLPVSACCPSWTADGGAGHVCTRVCA